MFRLIDVGLVRAGKTVLDSIDWRIESGSISVVMGPTGSGKTSALRLLNRLDDPSSGEILYGGKPISSYDVRALRREVSMVLQTAELFEGTVEENLVFGPSIHGLSGDVNDVISLVGLDPGLLRRDVRTLSVGQAQKVSIARAVAVGPRVLLLDEPTAALDPTSTLQTESLVRHLVRSMGITCVFVTHNVEQAKRIANHAILIIDGTKVEEGTMVELATRPHDPRTSKFMRGELK
jgi:ABC-type methionine transport system ATPase subunit